MTHSAEHLAIGSSEPAIAILREATTQLTIRYCRTTARIYASQCPNYNAIALRRDRRRCVVPVDHATLLSGPSLRAVPVVSWWCGASRRDSGHVPVRRDRALRLGQRLTPGADGAVQIVLQAVLVVGVGRSCRRLGPEVGHAIIAAQFQRDQVVDDIPPPCVMEEAVAPVYRALLAGETASAHELEETSSRLLCPV